ncbi:MAG: methyltransferase domain-containing protein [Calditrichaeota bacterium]|nr:methyltransferase domain-containing protein [Calditrichota bacterium]
MFWFVIRELWKSKSVTRSFLNYRLSLEKIEGYTIDLGAGKKDLYSTLIPQATGTELVSFDFKQGNQVDFETDKLPADENTYDTVLLLNVLEHIFNHAHLLKEIGRIKKPTGRLIGFVPFLMWYHPDPHDYFRYTFEALEKLHHQAGYQKITIESIHYGPFVASLQMIHTCLPRWARVIIFVAAYGLDSLFRILRPKAVTRYALGYYFVAE